MREISVPPVYVPGPTDNLTDDVVVNAAEHGEDVGYSRRVAGAWVPVTHAELAEQVRRLAAGLMASGVQRGDRVALFSATSFEWMLSDFAIWAAGAVTVPIYETSSAEQVQWILSDSGAAAAIVQGDSHAKTVALVSPETPALRDTWNIEAGDLDLLAVRGKEIGDDEVEARRTSVGSADLATIIYTSGTTGRPKGCAITHANLLCEVRACAGAPGVREYVFNERARTLLFLPLAHILARSIQLSAVHCRVHLAHTADIKDLVPQLMEFRPTSVLSVPRVFEKIYNSAQHKAAAEGKGRIFDVAAATAIEWSEAQDKGGPGILLRLRHGLFDRLVYGKLRAAIGGQVSWSVSGGAPLGARLGHFFRGVGINVLEGYGLTETCAGVTLNLPDLQRVGTVGRPIPGCSVRIADDGEVLLKGGNVFGGYWHNDEATREAIDEEGWFHSGDLGELDDEGYLTITGRKKDLIVTSAGKNVAPAVLEDRLRAHWLVSQCVVVGDGRPYVAALVTVDPEVFQEWKREAGHPEHLAVADLREDPALLAALQTAVDDANRAVSAAEAIKRFRVLPADFSEETGELTPTMKVKRNVVVASFHADVEALYRR